MGSTNVIFWQVDTQADFMLPEGKLFVPGAEKILPNIRKLVHAAREDRVLLVSHGCIHSVDDPEFESFAPHCVAGTPGAGFIPEALADRFVTVPNDSDSALPDDLSALQQIILEKQTLDIFESRHADALVAKLDPQAEIIVFGVVTEYCVRLAAKGLLERGRHVAIVRDAIETLNPVEGKRAIVELQELGARLVTTDEALALLEGQGKTRRAGSSST